MFGYIKPFAMRSAGGEREEYVQISKLSLDYQGIWYREVAFFKKIQKYIENLIEHNLDCDTAHDKDKSYYPKNIMNGTQLYQMLNMVSIRF